MAMNQTIKLPSANTAPEKAIVSSCFLAFRVIAFSPGYRLCHVSGSMPKTEIVVCSQLLRWCQLLRKMRSKATGQRAGE